MNAGRRRHLPIALIRRGAVASACERVPNLVRLAGVIAIAGLVAACASRPVGDFGRAQPGAMHDAVMPAIGTVFAKQRREPVSGFNQTDQEREMHDRTWRFLVAAQSNDWLYDTEMELQRTRIAPAKDFTFSKDRYYAWLKKTYYQSSRVRYATLGRHVLADLDTLPSTFLSICAVQEVDRNRAVALRNLSDVAESAAADLEARRVENQWHIDWFVRAVNYRFESYSYALDNLLVETPHEQSVAADASLKQLKVWADRASRYDFCSDADMGGYGGGVALPSRFQLMVPDTESVAQK